jgi:hypothetical protein
VRRVLPLAGIECRESGLFDIEDHYGIDSVRAAHPEIVNRITFGFVRHPVAWIKSRWAYAIESGFPAKSIRQPDAAAHWMATCWDNNFIAFVEKYLERHPGIATRTMFSMLGIWTRPVDFIGKTESLRNDLKHILEAAGEPFNETVICKANKEKVAACGAYANLVQIPESLAQEIKSAECVLCDKFNYE